LIQNSSTASCHLALLGDERFIGLSESAIPNAQALLILYRCRHHYFIQSQPMILFIPLLTSEPLFSFDASANVQN
jgi:hypothetical protein